MLLVWDINKTVKRPHPTLNILEREREEDERAEDGYSLKLWDHWRKGEHREGSQSRSKLSREPWVGTPGKDLYALVYLDDTCVFKFLMPCSFHLIMLCLVLDRRFKD